MGKKEIIKQIAKDRDVKKNEIYKEFIQKIKSFSHTLRSSLYLFLYLI